MNLKDNKRLIKQIQYLKKEKLFGTVLFYISQNTAQGDYDKTYFREISSIADAVAKNRLCDHPFDYSFLKWAFLWKSTTQGHSFWEHIDSILINIL